MKLSRLNTGVIIALWLLVPLLPLRAGSDSRPLRVLLARTYTNVKQITVSASGGLTIAGTKDGEKIAAAAGGSAATASSGPNEISLQIDQGECSPAGVSVTIAPNDPRATLRLTSPLRPTTEYRGKIELNLRSGALQLVNVIDIEDYLPGNVPREMPPSYPLEALKAQAIAARTYALANRGKLGSVGCDLCDTPNSQVYAGASAEAARSTQAVNETRGIVVLYGGKLAQVMYSADCGGATQEYRKAHPEFKAPYLDGVKEPDGISHSTWELTLALDQLAKKLAAAGVKDIEGLADCRVTKTDLSGRVLELTATATNGSVTFSGLKLRSALGTRDMRSLLFTVEVDEDRNIVLKGKGHGHGAGLCQVGSKGLALPPFNYTCEQILQHYFPGTTLSAPPQAGPDRPAPSDDEPLPIVEEPRRIEVTPTPPKASTEQDQGQDKLKIRVRVKAPDRL